MTQIIVSSPDKSLRDLRRSFKKMTNYYARVGQQFATLHAELEALEGGALPTKRQLKKALRLISEQSNQTQDFFDGSIASHSDVVFMSTQVLTGEMVETTEDYYTQAEWAAEQERDQAELAKRLPTVVDGEVDWMREPCNESERKLRAAVIAQVEQDAS